jgi:hypothetical protein
MVFRCYSFLLRSWLEQVFALLAGPFRRRRLSGGSLGVSCFWTAYVLHRVIWCYLVQLSAIRCD